MHTSTVKAGCHQPSKLEPPLGPIGKHLKESTCRRKSPGHEWLRAEAKQIEFDWNSDESLWAIKVFGLGYSGTATLQLCS